ncbi:MAG TPA: Gfo/Idh/MocA family oxidoreductase [Hyphomicrobium sp.]|nr:Gfo/Idh/MocA family oxidoreductase [Hyphomicrobium sp.]
MGALGGSNRPIRVGVVGAGFIAQVAHLHSLSRIDGVHLVGLAEPHDDLRNAVAQRFGIDRAVRDYRGLLKSGGVDAVVVSLPRLSQSLVVADALNSVPAVLSEKPMAMTFAEAQHMLAVARRSGATWGVGYMKRHDVGVRRFAKLINGLRSDGSLGPILDVRMRDACAEYWVAKPDHVRRNGRRPVRFAEAACAPEFVPHDLSSDYEYTVNVASHDLNLLRMLFGDALTAKSFHVQRGGAQHATLATGDFLIGLTVVPASVGHWDQRVDVVFAKGQASLVLPSPLARQESASILLATARGCEEMKVAPADHVWAFEAQARAFIEAVASRGELEVSGEACVGDLELIDGLWRKVELN